MVSILKDIPIDGVQVVLCRVNGPRDIVKSFLVAGDERLIDENLSQGRHPRMFLSGVQSQFRLGIPDKCMRESQIW